METLPCKIFWAPAAGCACEDLQEVLFKHQASDDIVQELQRKEAVLFKGCAGPPMPAAVRATGVSLLSEALKGRPANEDSTWFWSLQLFDAGCALLAGAAPQRESEVRVLVCAAAACLSGLALAEETANKRLVAGRASELADLATRLGGQGTGEFERTVSREDVVSQQQELLAKLTLHLCAPTVAVWVHVLLVRFDVTTNGVRSQALARVQEEALLMAQSLLVRRPTSVDCQPHVLAAGACAVALCAAGLVELAALRRLCRGEAEAEAVAAAVGRAGAPAWRGTAASPGENAGAEQQEAADLLRFALDCDDEQLQRALSLGAEAATSPRQMPGMCRSLM